MSGNHARSQEWSSELCCNLEVNMAKICGECIVRHDPTRGFSARLSSAPVYPQQLLERDVGPLPPPQDPPAFFHQIRIQNHLFDSWDRRRLARKEPKGLTAPHEPGRGAVGVRHYHKVNECKLNPLIRTGISVSSPNQATSSDLHEQRRTYICTSI
ncbi:uncharacterized protein LOC124259674 [Haliotis rubra]|uniref:uncharacterized protein LOC124259674 n=1 Tax=Haliotis rubra TaxID=36100 RepID=UPI001EE524B4|nr:uncharacterized protein LOC124259674 [Haliotis rubra]